AAMQLGLDEVLLVPAGEAPHRKIEPEPGKRVRLEMTELAADGNELLSASDVEIARGGPSYTFRTLELLAEQRPDDERWFLMAADGGESESLARELAGLAEAKLASDVVVLDVRELVGYTDFLVVCTARNERQAKAIHDEVHVRMKRDHGRLPASVEGEREARW